ncbi:DUF1788 domain-containing protein [Faecalibacillus intestinalis]|uniref:DUF1788 domain-containing protein n=1 Tax=Faecalibacillus intestinalis TaxID=1982626 RepID=UPI0022E62798|nr:DUF1788 domain-containing protein [Faecalibacillus intestinalis]
MSSITERLDELRKRIQEEDFLKGKGMSNEVNIRIFCYDPKNEMVVRYFVEQLSSMDLKSNVQIVDLYETFLSICEDKRILNRIPQLEEKRGKEFLEKQFEKTCDAKTFAKKVIDSFDGNNDLLMITGVGKAFPFMRVHALLNALQEDFNEKPIVVLYPGAFDGHYVKLFNRLKSNEYYRAFNMI